MKASKFKIAEIEKSRTKLNNTSFRHIPLPTMMGERNANDDVNVNDVVVHDNKLSTSMTTSMTTTTTTTTSRIAFGSCHKSLKSSTPPIWDVILKKIEEDDKNKQQHDDDDNNNYYLDGWLWLGDAIYPKNHRRHPITNKKQYGPASPNEVKIGLQELKYNNATIGYKDFLYRLVNQEQHKHNHQQHNYSQQSLSQQLPIIVGGVWDDHDYGGNDMGAKMPNKKERQTIYRDFLSLDHHAASTNNNNQQPSQESQSQQSSSSTSSSTSSTSSSTLKQKIDNKEQNIQDRDGMYHRIDFENGKIRFLVLDTRWHREDHCIPSFAHAIPKGNAVACLTRWLTSGLLLHRYSYLWNKKDCGTAKLLGDDQWTWLENELLSLSSESESSDSDSESFEEEESSLEPPELFIILSSIQVWSTNPVMESWGQFPQEQERLYNLLRTHYNTSNETTHANANTNTYDARHAVVENRPATVLFLSGDVHHGEISGKNGYLEITSSGLTHHCGQNDTLYGPLCEPILKTFSNHRYRRNTNNKQQHQHQHQHDDYSHNNDGYYIGLNYGVLEITSTTPAAAAAADNSVRRQVHAQIKNSAGHTVLDVIQPLNYGPIPNLVPYSDMPHTWDGHLITYVQGTGISLLTVLLASIMYAIIGKKDVFGRK